MEMREKHYAVSFGSSSSVGIGFVDKRNERTICDVSGGGLTLPARTRVFGDLTNCVRNLSTRFDLVKNIGDEVGDGCSNKYIIVQSDKTFGHGRHVIKGNVCTKSLKRSQMIAHMLRKIAQRI